MDCYFFIVLTISLFFLCLVFPQIVVAGASAGLMLWFQNVLPVLLPFMILTQILVKSNGFTLLSTLTRPLLCPFFHISENGAFALVIGFLCGYPTGSKVIADLKKAGKISYSEAAYLLSFCNQTSPMFLISYVFYMKLKQPQQLLPGLLLIEGTPVLASFIFRRVYRPVIYKENTSKKYQISFPMIDSSIMQSFETVTKIGGYIILFSILLQFGRELSFNTPVFSQLILPSLEITNGIAILSDAQISSDCKFILATALCSFGGWCSVAQTYSMIQQSGLSICDYIKKKLIITGMISLLSSIYIF